MEEKQVPVVEEPTEEQLKLQIAELQAKLKSIKKELTPEEKAQKEKEAKFFKELKRGAMFIKFIVDDLQRHDFNRHARRRLLSQMLNKQFSIELIETYIGRIDEINTYLDEMLAPKTEIKDGVEFYKEAKDAQAKGELK